MRPLASAIISGLLALVLLAPMLGGCALPQVKAEDRLFLDISLNFLGSYTLPAQSFDGEPVGGISAIAYDLPRDRLYALSDNRDRPRFYTLKPPNFRANLKADLQTSAPALTVESVTYFKDNQGNPYAPGDFDPEGMALTPTGTLLISSEGSATRRIAPAIGEYDLVTGQIKTVLPLPVRYLPDSVLSPEAPAELSSQAQGVQENLGFEALAINVSSGSSGIYEPYRLFVATEGPLLQDLDFAPEIPYKNRLLHYLVDPYQSTPISEHLYEMDLAPTGAVLHGLSEIAVLDQSGHFLALERSFGFQGFAIKLYQLASGGATDISAIASLRVPDNASNLSGISPIRKQIVLDFNAPNAALNIPLENYEAMAFGPDFSNGTRSLLIMSDDNFSADQTTRLLVFQLSQS